jgi:hypothetical protein
MENYLMYNLIVKFMNNQKITYIIASLIILMLSYFAYILFGERLSIENISKNTNETQLAVNTNLEESNMRIGQNVVQEKFEDKGKTIWKGSGFEPGFYFEIKEGKENSYPAKFNFQNEGEMFGSFTLVKNENTIEYEGGLLLGGDGMVSTKIKIENKKCFHASGEETFLLLIWSLASRS